LTGLTIWQVLELAATNDTREIRRAYARRLKIVHPEDDADGFKQLRTAYEWAMQLAQEGRAVDSPREADGDEDDEPAGEVDSPPEVARDTNAEPAHADSVPDAPPPAPADPLLEEAAALFRELGAALHSSETNPEAELLLLRRLLDSPSLERLDILQRAEHALAVMLAEKIPRADHLLAAAAERFEWSAREHDRSLGEAALHVLTRIQDLKMLPALRAANTETGRAWRRLLDPGKPWQRWTRAFFVERPSELNLIHELRDRHPMLLREVPRENIEWWDRFATPPHASRGIFLLGNAIAFLLAFMGLSGAPRGGEFLRFVSLYLAGALAAVGVVALKFFAFDLPANRFAERFPSSRAPARILLAWMPAGFAGLLFTALVTTWSGPEWLAWLGVVSTSAAALWAIWIAGHTPPLTQATFWQTRLLRIIAPNVLVFVWLFALLLAGPSPYMTPPLFWALLTVAVASGIARPIQVELLEHRVPEHRRTWLSHLGVLVTLGFGVAVAFAGEHERAAPLLVATNVMLVVLRRSMPQSFASNGNDVGVPFLQILGCVIGAGAVAMLFNIGPDESGHELAHVAIFGCLAFQIAALVVYGRELFKFFQRL
jgi:hypothetical protein